MVPLMRRAFARSSIRFLMTLVLVSCLPGMAAQPISMTSAPPSPQNFIYFERERERISEKAFLENGNIIGAQLKYTWRELEPERDTYHLKPLVSDLEFLQQHGKRLFIQIQDVSFSKEVLVPEYLCKDPSFNGGVAQQYEIAGDDESKAQPGGWVARRWDPAVRDRFVKLLDEIGKAVDGRIEGVNLPETAVEFGESGKLHPKGFTYATYLEGVKLIMTAARRAFPRSCVIQYANFMPGEWLPGDDHGYLRAVYAHAQSLGVGVGGPDLKPHRKGQQHHSYPLIAGRGPKVPAGVAVQDDNLEEKDPTTGKQVTVADLYRFAADRLRLDYIFWGTQEPFYSKDICPFIQGLGGGK